MYKELLKYLRGVRSVARICFALHSEVATWWRKRSNMRVVNENDYWYIRGRL